MTHSFLRSLHLSFSSGSGSSPYFVLKGILWRALHSTCHRLQLDCSHALIYKVCSFFPCSRYSCLIKDISFECLKVYWCFSLGVTSQIGILFQTSFVFVSPIGIVEQVSCFFYYELPVIQSLQKKRDYAIA